MTWPMPRRSRTRSHDSVHARSTPSNTARGKDLRRRSRSGAPWIGRAAVGRDGRRHRRGSHGGLPGQADLVQASAGRGEEGRDHGGREGSGITVSSGQRAEVRSAAARAGLERLVHDQLSRDGGQVLLDNFASPRLRVHHPLLHERSAHPRLPPQDPRAGRAPQHDPDDHGSATGRSVSSCLSSRGGSTGSPSVPTANVSVVDSPPSSASPRPRRHQRCLPRRGRRTPKGILDATDESWCRWTSATPHSSIVDSLDRLVDGNRQGAGLVRQQWGTLPRAGLIRYMVALER